jgi:hypothetical protein
MAFSLEFFERSYSASVSALWLIVGQSNRGWILNRLAGPVRLLVIGAAYLLWHLG